jgi:hypothetical protein
MQGLMLLNESQELLQGKQNIKKGNGHIRRALFMPAFVAVKHNEKTSSGFNRTIEKHG